jgi:hypothetical protein
VLGARDVLVAVGQGVVEPMVHDSWVGAPDPLNGEEDGGS